MNRRLPTTGNSTGRGGGNVGGRIGLGARLPQPQQQQPNNQYQSQISQYVIIENVQPGNELFIPQTRQLIFHFRDAVVNDLPFTNVGRFLQQLIQNELDPNLNDITIVMRYNNVVLQLNQRQTRQTRQQPETYYRRSVFNTRNFNNEETQTKLENMVESFMNSNQDFEWSNFKMILLQTNNQLSAGGIGEDESKNEQEVEQKKFGSRCLIELPKNSLNLCGYIALLVHFKKYEVKLQSIYPELLDFVDSISKNKAFSDWLKKALSTSKLFNAAKKLSQFIECNLNNENDDNNNNNNKFDLYKHGDMFVEMFPKFKIIIVDNQCNIMGDMVGNEYDSSIINANNDPKIDIQSLLEPFTIILRFNNDHFDLVINLNSYFRKVYSKNDHKWRMCIYCWKSYNCDKYRKDIMHTCKFMKRCQSCLKPFVNNDDYSIHISKKDVEYNCVKCKKQFFNDECFNYHLNHCGRSKKIFCNKCLRYYFESAQHDCGKTLKTSCRFCHLKMENNWYPHDCVAFIQKLEFPNNQLKLEDIYAFDIECYVDPESNVHIPNLICAKNLNDDQMLKFDTVDQFLEFICSLQQSKTFYAHNFGGYDGRVLFKYFINHPKIILSNALPVGSKFMSYRLLNGNTFLNEKGKQMDVIISFKDSFNHMSQALRTLPKTYGLDLSKFQKGFYPHSFNTSQNRFYKGPMPDIKYFHHDEMKTDERLEFIQWYNHQIELQNQFYNNPKNNGNHFYDHYREFVKYCESDVNVLAESLIVYAKEYMKQCNGLNPLQMSTIASHCMNHYKINHMPEKSIVCLKPHEFLFTKPAFFGGRTHPCSLLVENSQIGYVDVNSLYPSVMVNCPLPTGPLQMDHVNKKMTNEQLLAVHGIIDCDVEPIKYLHHPIFCERNLDTYTNTYPLKPMSIKTTSVELHEAIKSGCYKVTYVRSILKTNVSLNLFKSYIYEAQTAKLLASGEPPEFNDPQEKEKFLNDYLKEMNVDLSKMKFEKNPGKRATAKLTNNSLWGKFGENTTRIIMNKFLLKFEGKVNQDESKKFHQLLIDIFNGDKVLYANFNYETINHHVCYLFTKDVDYNFETYQENTNIMLCAFITAHARMTLWKTMHKLGDRVLYCDTDSIIYILDQSNQSNNIKSSSKLGEWKDECEGDIITDFVTIAAKSYAYKLKSGKEIVKCKGVSLNFENSNIINFNTFKQLVIGEKLNLTTKHLKFNCDNKEGAYQMKTDYIRKKTKLTKNNGCILNTNNEYGIQLPRDFMIFPEGFENFLDDLKSIYNKRNRI